MKAYDASPIKWPQCPRGKDTYEPDRSCPAKGRNPWAVKFLVDANSREILGAAILGVGGDEIINGIAAWMHTGLPYTEFQRAVMVHPTVTELMPWVFENLEPLD